MIHTLILPPPPVSVSEVLRYSGVKSADDITEQLVRECIEEALPQTQYKLCYRRLPLTVKGDCVTLGDVSVCSSSLSDALRDAKEALIFAATVGIGIDRLIARYQTVSPAKAVILQAFGAERIEALCDAFCQTLSDERSVTDRFSPGYGDLSLTFQREMFALLDCPRKIGLTLGGSLLMSPSKSVTAIVGIGGTPCKHHGCEFCQNTACEFRRSL